MSKRKKMGKKKKVTLLLPDKIIHTMGSSRSTYTKEVDLTAEGLINALSLNAYHERWRFKEADIEVLSIRTVREKQQKL